MNTTQTLEIYKILNRHFKNDADAIKVIEDIQQIIDHKFEEKRSSLASGKDMMHLENKINEDIMRLENKLNDHLKWLMATIIAVGGIIVALIKLG